MPNPQPGGPGVNLCVVSTLWPFRQHDKVVTPLEAGTWLGQNKLLGWAILLSRRLFLQDA